MLNLLFEFCRRKIIFPRIKGGRDPWGGEIPVTTGQNCTHKKVHTKCRGVARRGAGADAEGVFLPFLTEQAGFASILTDLEGVACLF